MSAARRLTRWGRRTEDPWDGYDPQDVIGELTSGPGKHEDRPQAGPWNGHADTLDDIPVHLFAPDVPDARRTSRAGDRRIRAAGQCLLSPRAQKNAPRRANGGDASGTTAAGQHNKPMKGTTEMTITQAPPETGQAAVAGRSSVLAQVDLYFEQHPEGRPPLSAVLSLKPKGTVTERVAYVEQVAAWLGVTVTERYGTRFAQRLFADERGDRLIIEAHVTPDRDAAHAAIVQAHAAGRPATPSGGAESGEEVAA